MSVRNELLAVNLATKCSLCALDSKTVGSSSVTASATGTLLLVWEPQLVLRRGRLAPLDVPPDDCFGVIESLQLPK
jgi:hypothetical protein